MKLTRQLYIYSGVAAATLSSLLVTGSAHAADAITDTSGLHPAGQADFGTSSKADLQTPLLRIGNLIINIVFIIAGIVAILYLVYSGILYITSAGNQEKTKIARQGVINSIIGIIIIAAAYAIIKFAITVGSGFQSANT